LFLGVVSSFVDLLLFFSFSRSRFSFSRGLAFRRERADLARTLFLGTLLIAIELLNLLLKAWICFEACRCVRVLCECFSIPLSAIEFLAKFSPNFEKRSKSPRAASRPSFGHHAPLFRLLLPLFPLSADSSGLNLVSSFHRKSNWKFSCRDPAFASDSTIFFQAVEPPLDRDRQRARPTRFLGGRRVVIARNSPGALAPTPTDGPLN
jgi:hypothetical protein